MKRWFPEFEELERRSPEEARRIKAAFRQLFSTQMGQEVLTSILSLCKFYSQADRPEDMELQNTGKKILYLCGIWEDGKELMIVNKLLGGGQS